MQYGVARVCTSDGGDVHPPDPIGGSDCGFAGRRRRGPGFPHAIRCGAGIPGWPAPGAGRKGGPVAIEGGGGHRAGAPARYRPRGALTVWPAETPSDKPLGAWEVRVFRPIIAGRTGRGSDVVTPRKRQASVRARRPERGNRGGRGSGAGLTTAASACSGTRSARRSACPPDTIAPNLHDLHRRLDQRNTQPADRTPSRQTLFGRTTCAGPSDLPGAQLNHPAG